LADIDPIVKSNGNDNPTHPWIGVGRFRADLVSDQGEVIDCAAGVALDETPESVVELSEARECVANLRNKRLTLEIEAFLP